MRRRGMLGSALAACCGLGLAPPSAAQAGTQDVGGVRFELQQPLAGRTLLLNGAGIRYKAIFRVYAAGLYLPARATSLDAIRAMTGPKRLQVAALRDIDGKELGKLFTQGMERNSSRETFSRVINGTLHMAEVFARRKQLASGDQFSIDWVPGTGTQIAVNRHPETEPIAEPEFFDALLAIWLGASPADAALKDALLGLPASTRPFAS